MATLNPGAFARGCSVWLTASAKVLAAFILPGFSLKSPAVTMKFSERTNCLYP
ncbi:hypothetical protein FB99_42430 (plasmid) [Pantoea agglomerans]|nr:hypothetical protein FB99_42430 [Pantoea agglomerans]